MVSVQNKKLRLLLLCKENVISTKFMHLLDFSHISLILCITSSALQETMIVLREYVEL